MILLLNGLQDTIPLQCIKDHITTYADDLSIFCLYLNEQELCDAIRFSDAVIMAIERLGLKLSPQKSCVLLKGKGSGFFHWKKHTVDNTHKSQPCLPLCGGNFFSDTEKMSLLGGDAFM